MLLQFSLKLMLFSLLCCKALCATSSEKEFPALWSKTAPSLEAKGGYFLFGSHKMRKIYKSGGADAQFSVSCPVWKGLQLYGSVEYLERKGRFATGERTSIWELPVSFGLKPVFNIGKWSQYYVTLGPRYFFVYQHNSSPDEPSHVHKNGLGGFVNTGFNFFPYKHMLIGLFGEYSYKRMTLAHSEESAQVGGFTFGGSIGYLF